MSSALPAGRLARGFEGDVRQDWPLRRSSELFELRYGKALVASKRRPGAVPVYGTNGQTGTHDQHLFDGPGIVVGRKGAGHLGVHWSERDFWVIDTAYSLVLREAMDLRYSYFLLNYVGLDHLKHGTSNPSLTRDAFAAQYFPIPPLADQQAVAGLFSAIDDRIDSSRRVVALIPQLIRAHIDSVLIKRSMTVPVSNLARFVNGGAYTKGATGTGRMVIRIAELNSGPGASTVYNDIDVPDDRIARPGDTLMSWSGSLGVYRWALDAAIVNQHIFKVIPTVYPAWLVFDRLQAIIHVFQAVARDKATTMGHIQREHLESTSVQLPDREFLVQLDSVVAPLWERLLVAEQEIVRLVRLRDALLPELLSGRLRVQSAVDGVGEVCA